MLLKFTDLNPTPHQKNGKQMWNLWGVIVKVGNKVKRKIIRIKK